MINTQKTFHSLQGQKQRKTKLKYKRYLCTEAEKHGSKNNCNENGKKKYFDIKVKRKQKGKPQQKKHGKRIKEWEAYVKSKIMQSLKY